MWLNSFQLHLGWKHRLVVIVTASIVLWLLGKYLSFLIGDVSN